jgi:peptidyl-prolyl cis-trans isomerase SurA
MVAACGSGAPPSAAPAKATSPDVWAVVNGTEITRDRINQLYRSVAAENKAPQTDEEVVGAKLAMLDELITKEVLLQRAKTLAVAPTDDEVTKSVTERRGGLNDTDFAKQLADRGMTADGFRDEVRRELTVQKVMEREVTSKVNITDEEVKAYFDKNRNQFNVPERQYHLAQIVVSASPTPQARNRRDDAKNAEQANRKLVMIAERLRTGDDFGTLAADYSEDPESAARGGDLGFVPQSSIDKAPPQLRKTVLEMKPGQVRTFSEGDTTTIVALVKHQEPGQREATDPEVKDAIRNALRDRRQQLLQSAFLSRVRAEATIVNNLVRQVVDAEGKLPTAAQTK